ncbi:Cof-type HAD-IIB family hydrolase [Paenibacillus sp. M1]|uniref:Cof-type HAD-IIB family hydrolase n=1 Tax=Paenibacillus haidiansis TaxID=1574488 RepID=A0ABU7VUF0_9BACL
MKLIAIDLDGTLLTAESKPSEEGLAAIQGVISRGASKVAICTGRASYDVRNLVGRDLELPIISFNGAAVHDEGGRLLNETPIDHDIAAEAVRYLTERDVYFEIFCPEAIYSPSSGEDKLRAEMDVLRSANPDIDRDRLWKSALVQFVQFGIEEIDHPQQVIDSGAPVYKLLIFTYDEAKLTEIRRHFDRFPGVHTTSSADHTLEIISTATDKGSALRFLAEHYGVLMEDTVVIGDSHNDISMFRVAGTRIAMGNAIDEIKELSSAVTRDNNHHGVAYALNVLLGL